MFKVTIKTQKCTNISILLWQHVSVLLDQFQANILRYDISVHIMYYGIPYYLKGVHKNSSNCKKLYIWKVVKKYVMVLNLYWSGWKYIVYKLLAYWYLYNLNQLGRYCDSHLKVVKLECWCDYEIWPPSNVNRSTFQLVQIIKIPYLLTYLLTYSMEQSPSWDANWFCS